MDQNENRVEQVLTKMNLLRRAKAGFDFMNENAPDWQCLIDIDQLDMSDCNQCILGQCFGFYKRGLDELCLSLEHGDDACLDRVALGFGMSQRTPAFVNNEPYLTVLTRCWKKLLKKKRRNRRPRSLRCVISRKQQAPTKGAFVKGT